MRFIPVRSIGLSNALPNLPGLPARRNDASAEIHAPRRRWDRTENGIDRVPIVHAGGWKSPSMALRYTRQAASASSTQLSRRASQWGKWTS